MTFSMDQPRPARPGQSRHCSLQPPIFSFYTGMRWLLDHWLTWVNKHIHNVLRSNVTISRPKEHLIIQNWKKLSLSLYYSIIDVSELNNFHKIKSIEWNHEIKIGNMKWCSHLQSYLEQWRMDPGSESGWTLPWPAAHPAATSRPPRQRNTFKGLGWFHTLRKLDWVVRAGDGIAFNL